MHATPRLAHATGLVIVTTTNQAILVFRATTIPTVLLANTSQEIPVTHVVRLLGMQSIPLLAHVTGLVIVATTNLAILVFRATIIIREHLVNAALLQTLVSLATLQISAW
jgi:hypothetical protein